MKITKFDAAEYLDSPKAIAAYLDAAMDDGDPAVIAAVLGDIARARAVAKKKTAMRSRGSLAPSPERQPPNQRARRLDPNLSFSARMAADGS
jgi:probable addiction module antidote protein